MHVCNRCGKENQDHYKFCLGCGSELAPTAPAISRAPVLASVRDDDADAATAMTPAATPSPSDTDPGRLEAHAAKAGPRAVPAPAVIGAVQIASMPAAALAPEPSGRSCPSCGTFVPTGFVFCGQCGTRVAEAQPKAAPVPVASSPSPRGKLVLIRPDGSEGGTHNLTSGVNRIGRGMGTLFDADSYLSPHHADLVLGPNGLNARDAGSLNGVFIKLIDEEEIIDSEVFRIGQELLRFDVIRPPVPLEDGTEVMGSPNPGYWGRLALIIGKEQDGSAFPLFGEQMVLGRERGDILFAEDGYVSGTHARISFRGGRYYLADLNSSNGTFLRIRGERTVRSGTFLLMGQQLFRVQYS